MLVSIIIPCYNVEKYIAEAVASALAQTHKEIEVILIDNNSSDSTFQILQQLQNQSPEKIQVISETKKGACAARNKGLSVAKGEWVQFLDADDLLQPEKIAHQLQLIAQSAEEITVVAASYYRRNVQQQDSLMRLGKDLWISLFRTQLGITSANLWNKKWLSAAKGWDEALKSSQEYDLMFRMFQLNPSAVFDTQALTIVRERESGQISQANPAERWSRYLALRIRIYDYIQKQQTHIFETQKTAFQQAFFDLMRTTYPHLPQESWQYFQQYLSPHFQPQPSPATSATYVKLYRWLGFRGAEKVKKWLR